MMTIHRRKGSLPPSCSMMIKARPLFLIVAGIILFVAPPLLGGSITTQQAQATTTTTAGTLANNNNNSVQNQQTQVLASQQFSTSSLEGNANRQVNGLFFSLRWGPPTIFDAHSPGVMFADCLPGEFPMSATYILMSSNVFVIQSYPIVTAQGNGFVSWVAIVHNRETTQQTGALGVICASATNSAGTASTVIQNPIVKTEINNAVKNIVKIQNNQIINLQQVFQIRQTLIQNAIQIAVLTGNNNTVIQSINQSATQIANQNVTNPQQAAAIINNVGNQTTGGGGNNATGTEEGTKLNSSKSNLVEPNNENATQGAQGPNLNTSKSNRNATTSSSTEENGASSSSNEGDSGGTTTTETDNQDNGSDGDDNSASIVVNDDGGPQGPKDTKSCGRC
jgi:hypothetical protein